jgi:hypothetical protein
LLAVGTVLLTVLLLNLLIAMFSKTFDTIVENSTQEYMLQKAQLTFVWMAAPRLPPPLALAMAIKDSVMQIIAKYACNDINLCHIFCTGKNGANSGDGESSPNFDRMHFLKIAFPCWPNDEEMQKLLEDHASSDALLLKCFEAFKVRRDLMRTDYSYGRMYETTDQPRQNYNLYDFERLEGFERFKALLDTEFQKNCETKYQSWCDEVLQDFDENAEYNSEAQMDRFKSRVLRGMEKIETTVQASGKIVEMQEQIKELSALHHEMKIMQQLQIDEIKALSEILHSQRKMSPN